MDNKKRVKQQFRILRDSFLLLAVLAIAYSTYVYVYNNTKREYESGEQNYDFSVQIAPRTGQTDSWPKILYLNGKSVDYNGRIYDITIQNTGNYTISNWDLRINIEQDCFLNNAWCGTFEIHQMDGAQEKVQTIDLRDYKISDLALSYRIANPDFLIPLSAGDFIVYHPDFEANEYPIGSGDNLKVTQVVFGMILYDNYAQPLHFNSYHMEYHLHKKLFQSWIFVALCIGFGVWCVLYISFVTMRIGMHKAHVRFVEDEHIIKQSIGVFTRFFEAKDTYTRGHSQRVAEYSRMIAEKMNFDDDECRRMYYIALMHDCGKCYIPDAILKKPGKLTQEEFEVIKSHTVRGAEMLEDFDSIEHIRDGVLYHHERYDGKGYPEGLAGNNIPMVSRIICVADSFDAMNSQRCYRTMLSKEYILHEFQSNSGKQFDPDVVKAFLALAGEGKITFEKFQPASEPA